MKPLISDSSTDARMTGLERFLERYLGPRQPEFGVPEDEVRSITMPDPLSRFFRFAGRWPGHNPLTPFANRFCMQDELAGIVGKEYAQKLQFMDDRLVFVWENQGVWVAATEPTGIDPPVWVTEESSHRNARRVWRQLEKPLSHFLVSFVLQEVMFGSEFLSVASEVIDRFEKAKLPVEPVWINGEYVGEFVRLSYFLVDGLFLVRQTTNKADEEEWYGCQNATAASVLTSLGLPTQIP